MPTLPNNSVVRVRLPEDQRVALQKLADANDRNLSQEIRLATRKHIEQAVKES